MYFVMKKKKKKKNRLEKPNGKFLIKCKRYIKDHKLCCSPFICGFIKDWLLGTGCLSGTGSFFPLFFF